MAAFFWETDWGKLFAPQMSLAEVLVRGTLVYLALCLLLRVVLKRQAGKVSMTDLLVVSIVAGVCRNPLVRDAYSVTDGVFVIATVLGWSFALDYLSYHFPFVHRLLHAPPVPLIRDGKVLKQNLRRELVTQSQLCCKLRGYGVRGAGEVAEAWLEGDGHVSVIKQTRESREGPGPSAKEHPLAPHHNTSRPRAEPAADLPALAEAAGQLARELTRQERRLRRHVRQVREARAHVARLVSLVQVEAPDIDQHASAPTRRRR